MLKKWAYEHGLGDLYEEYKAARDEIAEECAAEGYPSHGNSYELRLAVLQEGYPEFFGDEEE